VPTRLPIAFAALLTLAACGFSTGPPPQHVLRATAQESFWRNLAPLCGHSYAGRMVEGGDSTYIRNRVSIRVRECGPEVVRIGFVIGPDTSRTWTVRKVPGALTLTHDVAGDPVTGYGGVTRVPGTGTLQEFTADTFTARTLPPAAHNVWWLEIVPGATLTYGVGRPGVRRRFRLEFDLRHPADVPVAAPR
jgi:hypothetical protein